VVTEGVRPLLEYLCCRIRHSNLRLDLYGFDQEMRRFLVMDIVVSGSYMEKCAKCYEWYMTLTSYERYRCQIMK
jgi:hypothetical protein